MTGTALLDLNRNLDRQRSLDILVEAEYRPTSLEQADVPDPADSTLRTSIHERGFVTVRTLSAKSRQVVGSDVQAFETQAWMIQDQGRWVIADEHDSLTPSSATAEWMDTRGPRVLPLGIIGVAMLAAALVMALIGKRERQQTGRPVSAPAAPLEQSRVDSHPAQTAPALPPAPRFHVRTFGALTVRDGDVDLTSELLSRPVAGFIWLYLVVRELAEPGRRVSRAELADEVFPGLSREAQRARLRDGLSRMRRELPEPLTRRQLVEGEALGLDLADADVDAARLREVATESRDHPVGEWLNAGIEILEATKAAFLPTWDDLARITEGRGTSVQMVRDLSEQLTSLRVDLIHAIGNELLGQGDTSEAVRWLREGLDSRPDRTDLARLLILALSENGQHSQADDLRNEYAPAHGRDQA